MRASFVILTTGGRPEELRRALASIDEQGLDVAEVVVVANGARIEPPGGARVVELPENVGIAAGRNVGMRESEEDVVFLLDDDAAYGDRGVVRAALEAFARDPTLGVVSFRIVDPATGEAQRRHIPRLRTGDAARSGPVTTFLGGACAIRREVLERVGAFPEAFFYAMEETDLAWRALDAGFRIDYRGDLPVHHPASSPTRHPEAVRRTARNRVWLARRLLPWPLAVAYVTTWTLLTLSRTRSALEARELFVGLRQGARRLPGDRQPISWATSWRMARLGRPPVV